MNDRKSWLADALTQVTLRAMSKKQHEAPADDWAGLAQNLFGIDLDKSSGDDDLLDKDMFKVEIPPPVEPAAPKISDELVTFTEAEPVNTAETPAPTPVAAPKVAVTKPKPTASSKPVVAKTVAEDDPFGAGILDEEESVAATSEAESSDEGLTLPEDFDDEGLTLASDFDDGLTLPPDHEDDGLTMAADDEGEDEDEDDDDDDDLTFSSENVASNEAGFDSDDDSEDAPAEGSDSKQAVRSESPRKRNPRRTREDAYWDMLENWEWEEIPESDSPRGEGARSPSRGGNRDRGGRGGDRGGRGGDRGGRGGGGRSGGDRGGRDERPRTAEPARSEERPRRDEPRPATAAPTTPRSESGAPASRPRRDDRPRDDRGPRTERRPDRDARRDEPRPAVASQSPAPTNVSDDFGSGIFEEQSPPPRTSSVPKPSTPAALPPREEAVAQSTQAADAVLRDSNRATGQSVGDELVWPDDNDNSDVRPAAMESVVETSGLPAADVAGESDRMVSASDVEPLDESEQRSRRPRRRRRRGGGPNSERTAPPDGNEGTTFDLSEALSSDSETPDFIPSAIGEDSAVSAEPAGDATGEGPSSQRRGSRRRRRRRPGENAPTDAAPNTNSEVHAESEITGPTEIYEDDEPVLKPIAYSNVPSWEEALRYLLEPHLVGRNLGPDDGDEGLASDPRGSGGAEPISAPPPPQQRRRRGGGGGGRGRRP